LLIQIANIKKNVSPQKDLETLEGITLGRMTDIIKAMHFKCTALSNHTRALWQGKTGRCLRLYTCQRVSVGFFTYFRAVSPICVKCGIAWSYPSRLWLLQTLRFFRLSIPQNTETPQEQFFFAYFCSTNLWLDTTIKTLRIIQYRGWDSNPVPHEHKSEAVLSHLAGFNLTLRFPFFGMETLSTSA
jgi:hypothetical protein